MRITFPIRRSGLALAIVATLSLAALRAEEPTLIGEVADGITELQGETRLEIAGLSGSLSLRVGQAGSIRFAARSLADRTEERKVALWSEGKTLRLIPPAGKSGAGLLVEVAVPSDLAEIRIEAADSKVASNDLGGRVGIVGRRLDLAVERQMGELRLEIEDSAGHVSWTKGDATVEGKGLHLTLDNVRGLLRMRVSKSEITISNAGSLEANLDASTLVANGLRGNASVEARGGSLELSNLAGAELQLAGTPLRLTNAGSAVRVETDSNVQFSSVKGDLSVTSYDYGASVQGSGVTGRLEIETNGAEVRLENLDGASEIRGKELKIAVTGSKGELSVHVSSSSVNVEQPEGPVTVENEFGDVAVTGAKGRVQIVNRVGDVRATDLTGSLDLRADSPGVEVSWAAFGASEDSYVENETGDVRLHVPSSWPCRIEAAAPRGTIQSSLKELRVSDDGTTASAASRGGQQPLLTVRAGGDIHFDTTPRPGGQ